MTELAIKRPTYQEVVASFSWDAVMAAGDWPAKEKYNYAHEVCDRWADNPAKADKVALRYETKDGTAGTYTFRELKVASNRFANVLTDLGVQKGDRVGGLLSKNHAVLPILLGTWKVGAVYVPLFTAFAPLAVAQRLRHSETRTVITDETNLSKILEGQKTAEGLPDLKDVIVVGAADKDFGADIVNFWAAVNAASPDFKVCETTQDDVLNIQYTSGSTGAPKGSMSTHRGGIRLQPYVRYAMDLREDDVFWGAADPGWSYGLITCLVGPLMVGTAATLIEGPFEPERCWQVMERYGITNFAYAPGAYRALMTAGAELAKKYQLKLRVASSAGEALGADVINWFQNELGVPIYDHYGQTELSMIVCNYHAFSDPVKPGSMGRPMPGFDVSLVDEEGNEVAQGEVGQIALNRNSPGYSYMGYWKEPEKSVANLRGKWHLTGDTARMDADGYFWFEGRADDLINASGYRLGPFEVESALVEHPAVNEVAVVAMPDPEKREIIKAFITLMPGAEGSATLVTELQNLVRERVGKHAYPRQIEFVEELPKTPSGKIQRYLLRRQK